MQNSTNRKLRDAKTFAILLMTIAAAIRAAEKPPEVPFPDGYRSWLHVKSVVIGPEHKSYAAEGGKIYHFYANPQAVEGYRAGHFRMVQSSCVRPCIR